MTEDSTHSLPRREWIDIDIEEDIETFDEPEPHVNINVLHPDPDTDASVTLPNLKLGGDQAPEAVEQYAYSYNAFPADYFDWRLYYINGERVEVFHRFDARTEGEPDESLSVAFGGVPDAPWDDDYPEYREEE